MQKLEIGQIVNTFGIKCFVKVKPFTDDITRFEKLKNVYIKDKQYQVQEVKYHKNMVLLKFLEVNSIEEAENLRNSYIQIDRKDGIKKENEYYIVDLLGLEVYDENDNLLGILEDIFNTGSNDIYVVKNKLGKQTLLPAISDVIKEINLEQKKIVVHLLKGLE